MAEIDRALPGPRVDITREIDPENESALDGYRPSIYVRREDLHPIIIDRPYQAAPAETNRLKDTVVGLGKGATGLVTSLIDVGALGVSKLYNLFHDEKDYIDLNKSMRDNGFDPEAMQRWFDSHYSKDIQDALKNVADADGFMDTLFAYMKNPQAIGAAIVENIPQMLPIFRAASAAAKTAMAAGEVKQLTGKALDKYVRNQIRIKTGIAEGSLSALQVSQQMGAENLAQGKAYGEGQDYFAAPIIAGVGTGILGQLNPMEANIMSKGLVSGYKKQAIKEGASSSLLKGAVLGSAGVAKRLMGTMAKEGFEEFTQSDWEQIVQNVAQDKPWDTDLGKVSAQSLVVGAASGGALHPFTKAHRETLNDATNSKSENQKAEEAATEAGLQVVTADDQAAQDAAAKAENEVQAQAIKTPSAPVEDAQIVEPAQTPSSTAPEPENPKATPLTEEENQQVQQAIPSAPPAAVQAGPQAVPEPPEAGAIPTETQAQVQKMMEGQQPKSSFETFEDEIDDEDTRDFVKLSQFGRQVNLKKAVTNQDEARLLAKWAMARREIKGEKAVTGSAFTDLKTLLGPDPSEWSDKLARKIASKEADAERKGWAAADRKNAAEDAETYTLLKEMLDGSSYEEAIAFRDKLKQEKAERMAALEAESKAKEEAEEAPTEAQEAPVEEVPVEEAAPATQETPAAEGAKEAAATAEKAVEENQAPAPQPQKKSEPKQTSRGAEVAKRLPELKELVEKGEITPEYAEQLRKNLYNNSKFSETRIKENWDSWIKKGKDEKIQAEKDAEDERLNNVGRIAYNYLNKNNGDFQYLLSQAKTLPEDNPLAKAVKEIQRLIKSGSKNKKGYTGVLREIQRNPQLSEAAAESLKVINELVDEHGVEYVDSHLDEITKRINQKVVVSHAEAFDENRFVARQADSDEAIEGGSVEDVEKEVNGRAQDELFGSVAAEEEKQLQQDIADAEGKELKVKEKDGDEQADEAREEELQEEKAAEGQSEEQDEEEIKVSDAEKQDEETSLSAARENEISEEVKEELKEKPFPQLTKELGRTIRDLEPDEETPTEVNEQARKRIESGELDAIRNEVARRVDNPEGAELNDIQKRTAETWIKIYDAVQEAAKEKAEQNNVGTPVAGELSEDQSIDMDSLQQSFDIMEADAKKRLKEGKVTDGELTPELQGLADIFRDEGNSDEVRAKAFNDFVDTCTSVIPKTASERDKARARYQERVAREEATRKQEGEAKFQEAQKAAKEAKQEKQAVAQEENKTETKPAEKPKEAPPGNTPEEFIKAAEKDLNDNILPRLEKLEGSIKGYSKMQLGIFKNTTGKHSPEARIAAYDRLKKRADTLEKAPSAKTEKPGKVKETPKEAKALIEKAQELRDRLKKEGFLTDAETQTYVKLWEKCFGKHPAKGEKLVQALKDFASFAEPILARKNPILTPARAAELKVGEQRNTRVFHDDRGVQTFTPSTVGDFQQPTLFTMPDVNFTVPIDKNRPKGPQRRVTFKGKPIRVPVGDIIVKNVDEKATGEGLTHIIDNALHDKSREPEKVTGHMDEDALIQIYDSLFGKTNQGARGRRVQVFYNGNHPDRVILAGEKLAVVLGDKGKCYDVITAIPLQHGAQAMNKTAWGAGPKISLTREDRIGRGLPGQKYIEAKSSDLMDWIKAKGAAVRAKAAQIGGEVRKAIFSTVHPYSQAEWYSPQEFSKDFKNAEQGAKDLLKTTTPWKTKEIKTAVSLLDAFRTLEKGWAFAIGLSGTDAGEFERIKSLRQEILGRLRSTYKARYGVKKGQKISRKPWTNFRGRNWYGLQQILYVAPKKYQNVLCETIARFEADGDSFTHLNTVYFSYTNKTEKKDGTLGWFLPGNKSGTGTQIALVALDRKNDMFNAIETACHEMTHATDQRNNDETFSSEKGRLMTGFDLNADMETRVTTQGETLVGLSDAPQSLSAAGQYIFNKWASHKGTDSYWKLFGYPFNYVVTVNQANNKLSELRADFPNGTNDQINEKFGEWLRIKFCEEMFAQFRSLQLTNPEFREELALDAMMGDEGAQDLMHIVQEYKAEHKQKQAANASIIQQGNINAQQGIQVPSGSAGYIVPKQNGPAVEVLRPTRQASEGARESSIRYAKSGSNSSNGKKPKNNPSGKVGTQSPNKQQVNQDSAFNPIDNGKKPTIAREMIARSAFEWLKEKVRGAEQLLFLTSHVLCKELDALGVHGASKLDQQIQERAKVERGITDMGNAVLKTWRALTDKRFREVNKLIAKSTLSREWYFDPEWLSDKIRDKVKASDGFKARQEEFNKLSKEEQQIVKDVFKYTYDVNIKRADNAFGLLKKEAEDRIAEYKAAGKDEKAPEFKQLKKALSEITKKYNTVVNRAATPYLSLRRHGSHIAVFKSKEYVKSLEDRDAAQAALDKFAKTEEGVKEADLVHANNKRIALIDRALKGLNINGFAKMGDQQLYNNVQTRARLAAEKASLQAQNENTTYRKLLQAVKDARAYENELATSPDHYTVTMHDSIFGAHLQMEKMKNEKGEGYYRAEQRKAQELGRGMMSSTQVSGAISALLAGMKTTDEETEVTRYKSSALKYAASALEDLYTEIVAAEGKQAMLKRRGISGFDEDLTIPFQIQNRLDAKSIANQEYGLKLAHTVSDIEAATEATKNPKARQLWNELIKRYHGEIAVTHASAMDSIVNNVRAYNTFTMLALKPAYYIQNLMQPIQMTMPLLVGRYGSEGYDAMREAAKLIRGTFKFGKDGNWDHVLEDFMKREDISDDEKKFLEKMISWGMMDIGKEEEMGRVSETNPFMKKLAKWHNWVLYASKNVEVINRVTAGLAAYRLEKAALMKDGKMDLSHASRLADQYAYDVLQLSQGSYSAFNSSRIHNTTLGKLMFQFRKFQGIQYSYLKEMVDRAILDKNLDPKERYIARKQLGIALATYGMLGGLKGLPGMTAAYFFLNALFGALSDDDDEDLETWFRREAASAGMDKGLVDAFISGPAALLGFELAPYFGAGDIINAYSYADKGVEEKSTLAAGLMALGGPTISKINKIYEGLVKEGGFEGWGKAGAAIAPRGATDLVRTLYRMCNGYESGEYKLMSAEEFMDLQGMADSVQQALGFSPKRVNDMYKRKEAYETLKKSAQAAYRSTRLDFAEAFKAHDYQTMQKLRARWIALNVHYYHLYGIPPKPIKELMNYPTKQAKEQAKIQGGLKVEKRYANFGQMLMSMF